MILKTLPAGKAYACDKCGDPMRPHVGPWNALHCDACVRTIDLAVSRKVLGVIDVDFEITQRDPFAEAKATCQLVFVDPHEVDVLFTAFVDACERIDALNNELATLSAQNKRWEEHEKDHVNWCEAADNFETMVKAYRDVRDERDALAKRVVEQHTNLPQVGTQQKKRGRPRKK